MHLDNRLEEGVNPKRKMKRGHDSVVPWHKLHMHSDALRRLLRGSEEVGQCRMWKGPVDSYGYGMITFKGSAVRTHRLMYRISFGPFDPSLCVLHRCDVPRCINPCHLFLGSKKDNSNDCVAKGRTARGAKIGISKLTEAQALEIKRASLKRFDRRIGNFARKFGVSNNTVRAVYKGQQWKYLP